MKTVEAVCPRCQFANRYGEELIGRYTLCEQCHSRFYVEVPALGAPLTPTDLKGPEIRPATAKATTLDDLLWDTQQGSGRLSELVRRQNRQLQFIAQCVVGLLVIEALNTILMAALLLR